MSVKNFWQTFWNMFPYFSYKTGFVISWLVYLPRELLLNIGAKGRKFFPLRIVSNEQGDKYYHVMTFFTEDVSVSTNLSLELLNKIVADDSLIFFHFIEKIRLGRWFTWNVILFSLKNRKKNQNLIWFAAVMFNTLRVKKYQDKWWYWSSKMTIHTFGDAHPVKTRISLCIVPSDQNSLVHMKKLWLSKMHPVKIQIRLRKCAVWSESSLGAHIRMHIFWWCGSIYFSAVYLCKRTMQNKQRLELADYEAENLARLQKMFSRKWEFIFMQAEAQAK